MSDRASYSKLPGIDSGPDVFQTPDLPETDQHFRKGDDIDSSVDVIETDYNKAASIFGNKRLDGDGVDFSDAATGGRGYHARDLYEVGGGRSDETLEQKLTRIRAELTEIETEVAAAASNSAPQLAPELIAESAHLSSALRKLELSEVTVAAADPLSLALPHIKKAALAGSTAPPASDGTGAVYRLYQQPDKEAHYQLSQLVTLEQRLNHLEQLVGQPDQLVKVLGDSGRASITGLLAELESRLLSLSPEQLDSLDGRLSILLNRYNQALDKKQLLDDQNKKDKVDELYNIVTKWAAYSDLVPNLVERLQSLQALHEQTLQFSEALSQLDSCQRQLSSTLVNSESQAGGLKTTMEANMTAITDNMQGLQKRLDALQDK